MKKWSFVALLLVGASILGATVLREPIAHAAQAVDATIIGPLDGRGNVKVHEQGIAQVAGTVGLSTSENSVKVDPANDRGDCQVFADGDLCILPNEILASLIIVNLDSDVGIVSLGGGLRLVGPGLGGPSHYVLPLTQPIRVSHLGMTLCGGTDCTARLEAAGVDAG
jgi:hypothetical protein